MIGCGDDPFPRPKGYFRLDLPPQRFQPYSGSCPLTAEVPVYALMTRHTRDSTASTDTACWVEMRFPFQHAEVFMTYRRIDRDLPELIQDAHAFKSKHEVKAARIRSERVIRDSARVFGSPAAGVSSPVVRAIPTVSAIAVDWPPAVACTVTVPVVFCVDTLMQLRVRASLPFVIGLAPSIT